MPTGDVTPDSLTCSIESMQETIKQDGHIVGADETRTRDELIRPLLHALGWNTPSVITAEYIVTSRNFPLRNTRVDYALHQRDKRGELVAFVEAKKMRAELTAEHRKQVFKYAKDRDVSLCILTNGDQWDLYKACKGSYVRTVCLSIRKQSASECARLLLAHFPKPPGFEAASIATPPEVPTSDSDAIIFSGLDREMDGSKVLAYFLSFLFLSSIYASFLNLWLNSDYTGLLRDIVYATVGVGYTIVFVYALFFMQPDKALSRYLPLSKPINGEKKRLITWYWVAIAVVFGVGIGGSSTFLLMNSLKDLISALSDLNIWLPPLVLLLVYVLIFWVPPLLVRFSRNKKKSQ